MLRRRALIIVNPAAGRSRAAARRLGRIVAALERRGCTVIVRRTATAADAERLARDAEAEFSVVIAAGGDGTLNAVANGIAGSGRTLALLPLGTANVAAREIGLPRDPERLAELIVSGAARPVWPGRVGDRLFLTVASAGFDAETVARVNPRLKRQLGRLAFVASIIVCWWRYRRCEISVEVEGVEHLAATVIAAKGSHYAGSYVIAPCANLGEPMLDLVLLQRPGRLAVLRALAALLFGRLPHLKEVVVLRCREAVLSAAAVVPVQADGELVSRLPVRIAVADAPLHLVQP